MAADAELPARPASTYDPNTGKLFSITNRTAIRAKDDFAVDLVTQIDPQQPGIRRKFSQINVQFKDSHGQNMEALRAAPLQRRHQ